MREAGRKIVWRIKNNKGEEEERYNNRKEEKEKKKTETQRDTREKKKKDHCPDLFATATPPPLFLFVADGTATARP